MEFGLYLRDICSDISRPLNKQISEAAEIVRNASNLRFSSISAPHHWISYPTVWPQPIPLLSRLAPEAGTMKLMINIIQLPLWNPIHLSEEISTLDHISNGNLICGFGLGYREAELKAVGATRQERAERMEESTLIMKQLWSGEEVNFDGRFWQVSGARMAMPPLQKPHPPIWFAAQSPGAVKRASSMANGCILGPQVGWQDLKELSQLHHQLESTNGEKKALSARRSISVAVDRKTAIDQARKKAENHFKNYKRWGMQESSMVELRLSFEKDMDDWAIVGSPDECINVLNHASSELKMDSMTLGFLNMPSEQSQKLEYLQYISEEVLSKVDN